MILKKIKKDFRTIGNPVAFSGINKIAKQYKISNDKARKILDTINTYSLHREYKKAKKTNPYFAYLPFEYVQMDLIDLSFLSTYNDNVKFILSITDVFTRQGFAYPLENKSAGKVVVQIKKFVSDSHVRIRNIQTDSGREFLNKIVQSFLKSENIHHYKSKSDIKCGIVERWNRTLQSTIFKYLTENNTFRYIDKLQLAVDSYNLSPHRSLNGISPFNAGKKAFNRGVMLAHNERYKKASKSKPRLLPIHATVRIKEIGGPFTKGYTRSWSEEVFRIVEINKRMPIPMYVISTVTGVEKDNDENVEGLFYRQELQECMSILLKINRIIAKEERRGKIFFLTQNNENATTTWVEKQVISDDFKN